MEITQTTQDDIQIVAISGRLDTLSSKQLKEALGELSNQGIKQLLIDCTDMDFISSSGLRVLLSTAKGMSSRKGKLVLCGLKEHVKEVFDIAGFTVIFSIFDDRAGALGSF